MNKFKVFMNNGKECVITAEDYQIVNLTPPEGRLVFYDSEEREVGRFFINKEMLDGIIRLDEEVLKKAEQPEPLTDAEQRIFLAAMAREEKICKQVDDEWQDGNVSLVRICEEIKRKVKRTLWTI